MPMRVPLVAEASSSSQLPMPFSVAQQATADAAGPWPLLLVSEELRRLLINSIAEFWTRLCGSATESAALEAAGNGEKSAAEVLKIFIKIK